MIIPGEASHLICHGGWPNRSAGWPSEWRTVMKRLILAAAAVLGLGVGGAFAQSYSHAAPPSDTHTAVNGR
jgi:hypothetical protein